jgi:hypothetical protein
VRGADVDFDDEQSGMAIDTQGLGLYSTPSLVGQVNAPPPEVIRGDVPTLANVLRDVGTHELAPGQTAVDLYNTKASQWRAQTESEARDLRQRELEKTLMHTGRRYFGIEVFIGGKSPLKGFRGRIVGDHDSAERVQRLDKRRKHDKIHWSDQDGIMVTIREDATLRQEVVDVKCVYHE